MKTNVYVPFESFVDLSLALKAQGLATQKGPLIEQLDTSCLHCLSLSFQGLLTSIRTPFAFPFINAFLQGEFHAPVHLEHGPDWMYLGGDTEIFANLLLSHVRETEADLTLIPFKTLCGTVAQTPSMHDTKLEIPRRVTNYNEKQWQDYVPKLEATDIENWGKILGVNTYDWTEDLLPQIQRYVTRPIHTIVDLGCGLGQTAYGLAKQFPQAEVVGLDVSEKALELARKAFRLPNLSFGTFDFSDPLPFKPQSVDLFVSFNAMAFAADQLQAADSIFSRLHPDGMFINHCRSCYSHDFWGFPYTLLFQQTFQLEPENWNHVARQHGFHTRVMPSGDKPYFAAGLFARGHSEPVKQAMTHCQSQLTTLEAEHYQYYMSHFMLLHSRHVESNTDTVCTPSTCRTEALGQIVASASSMPKAVQDTARQVWTENVLHLGLTPQAIEYIRLQLG